MPPKSSKSLTTASKVTKAANKPKMHLMPTFTFNEPSIARSTPFYEQDTYKDDNFMQDEQPSKEEAEMNVTTSKRKNDDGLALSSVVKRTRKVTDIASMPLFTGVTAESNERNFTVDFSVNSFANHVTTEQPYSVEDSASFLATFTPPANAVAKAALSTKSHRGTKKQDFVPYIPSKHVTAAANQFDSPAVPVVAARNMVSHERALQYVNNLHANKEQAKIQHAAISSMQFTFISTEEVLRYSVMEVTNSKAEGPNSVSDLRLGPTNPNGKDHCATCDGKWKVCPGHFGHIKLPFMVPHPLRMKSIVEFLTLFCFFCKRLVISQATTNLSDTLHNKKGEAKFRAMVNESKKISICPECTHSLCDFSFDEDYRFFRTLKEKSKAKDAPDNGKEKVLVKMDEIVNVFSNIPDCDIETLGLNPKNVHPSDLLLGAILVLPPCDRTSVTKATGASQNDDLDGKYCDIIKGIQKYHKEAHNSKTAEDIYYNVCSQIGTLMDNSKNKDKNKQAGRARKCLKKRIGNKGGHIRGNIMGKRVDFSARSVITPEANGWVDELVVPEHFAKNLTYSVHVNKTNLKQCQQLFEEDKVVSITRNGNSYNASKKLYTRGFDLHDNDIIRRTNPATGVVTDINVYAYKETNNGQLPELKPNDVVFRYNKVFTDVPLRQRLAFTLQEGDVIDRQLQNGDWTLFNRQPTLWKGSMRAMRIKIMPGRTFRFNMACTQAYNADHDKQNLCREQEA